MAAKVMSSGRLLVVTLACVSVAACSGNGKRDPMTRQEMIAADPLPFARGAKWTYEVTVKKFDVDADKETTRTLEWSTEVIDV